MKAKALVFVSLAVVCCLSAEAAKLWAEKPPPSQPLASLPNAARNTSAVEGLGMVETDWLAQVGKRPFDDKAIWLSARSRQRIKRLASLPPVVFLKNATVDTIPCSGSGV